MIPVEHRSQRRLFTVDEANAMLPLVRAIVSDLSRLAHEVSDRWERLSYLWMDRPWFDPCDPYTQELVQVGDELRRDRRRLREYADELVELGGELKSAVDGLVDFPAIVDGRMVFLCWKLGEAEIRFWHEVHEEFGDRQSLTELAPADDHAVVAAGTA